MVQQDRFIIARALKAWMRNLYGMRAGLKTINNRLLFRGYHAIGTQGSPCWLPTTAVSAWRGNRGGRTWQWPNGSMSSSVTSPDFNFTWQMADLGYIFLPGERFQQRCQAYRSMEVVVRYTSVELFTVVPNRLLHSPTDTSPVSSTGTFSETP